MRINRKNYIEYFLDYWEERLSQDQLNSLYAFLEENPDLKDEFYSYDHISLEKDNTIFYPDKKSLKKEENNISEFDELCIAFYEGDIDKISEKRLFGMIRKNPALEKSFKLYCVSKLNKDTGIHFPDKESMKKSRLLYIPSRSILIKSMAAAAVILIALVSYILLFQESGQKNADTDVAILKTDSLNKHINVPPKLKIKPSEILAYSPQPKLLQTKTPRDFIAATVKLPYKNIPALSTDNKKIKQMSPYKVFVYYADNTSSYDIIPEAKEDEKSLAGKILANLGNKIKNLVFPSREVFNNEEENLFWNIAETGVNGYNLITANSFEIVRNTDNKGKTRSIRIIDNSESLVLTKE